MDEVIGSIDVPRRSGQINRMKEINFEEFKISIGVQFVDRETPAIPDTADDMMSPGKENRDEPFADVTGNAG